ncbi:hypothetical protein [Polaromonas hydrogenivorans]|uniref:Uncharacterized protein n=1 Tax=Polaromonas hydrogenivorans TaxID=335476 RepID=A0AAU7LYT2_9BURK
MLWVVIAHASESVKDSYLSGCLSTCALISLISFSRWMHLLNLAPQALSLVLQFGGLGAIEGLQCVQVALDAFVNLALTVVDRLEFAAIHGHNSLRQQFQFPAQHHKVSACVADSVVSLRSLL